MADVVSTEALILRLTDTGDTHRVASLLTRELGRLSVLARGARQSSRRFGGQLDVLQAGQAHLGRARLGAIPGLTGFDVTRPWLGLRSALPKFAAACFFVELAEMTTPQGDAVHSSEELDLVLDALDTLDASTEPVRRDLVLGFQLRWFRQHGVLPTLEPTSLSIAGLPALDDQPLAIARALSVGVTVPELDAVRFVAVGALTRALRERIVGRPMQSLRFLHEALSEL